jgi:hypothetical protein
MCHLICLGDPGHIERCVHEHGAVGANIGSVRSRELFPRSANATSLAERGTERRDDRRTHLAINFPNR